MNKGLIWACAPPYSRYTGTCINARHWCIKMDSFHGELQKHALSADEYLRILNPIIIRCTKHPRKKTLRKFYISSSYEVCHSTDISKIIFFSYHSNTPCLFESLYWFPFTARNFKLFNLHIFTLSLALLFFFLVFL